uniref:Ig-like domain-containing protein n=1 Tax=Salmo trutta TaxID=8032 RepID=A0A674C8J4_SALTR
MLMVKRCRARVLSTHIYSGHSKDDGQAKAVLTIHPKSSQIFIGESVTLRCIIQRGEVTDWKYTWRKDDVDSISRKHEYEISEVKISDNGVYRCLGKHIDNGMYSKWSDAVRLTVTALPTASVKMVTNQETLYSGDTVKLRCDISNYRDWTYHWLINKERLSSQTSKTTTISLSDQAGQYQCQGTRTIRPQNSYLSSSLHISVTALPTASVKASPRGPLYSGETVTLQCDISDNRDWTYRWHRDNQLLPNPTSKTTTISLPDQAGQYQCEGTRTRQPKKTYLSSSLTIIVASLPNATLTITPNPAYTGETVTLTCSVGSDSGWCYTWYKDNTKKVVTLSGRRTTAGGTFTISRAAESDQGLYWCQGEIQSRSISSIISDPVTITVKALPTASVKASPRGPLYSGETVTLQCDISDNRDWTYRWHRDNQLLPNPTSKTTTISLPDQAGQYQCEGTRTTQPKKTYLSSSLTIIVASLPKATLTITPNAAYTGETVTLTCSVGSDSGWSYTWYKDNTKKVVTLSGRHNTTGATFTISRAAESDQGLYWCQGEIQSRSISTIISDPVTITVKERLVAVLTLQPNWPQIFRGETVTLSCDIQGGEEIEYAFYNSGKSVYTKTEPEYRISPAKNGLYTCEGLQKRNGLKHSQTSNAIQLTVLGKSVFMGLKEKDRKDKVK